MSPTAVDTRRSATARTGSSRTGSSVPGGALREERQRRRSRRRRWVAAAIAALVVVVLLVAGWLVAMSSVLAARHVSVSGQHALTAAQVRDAAAVPLGVPLARQDLDAIAARAAALPQVESVHVVRDWPETVAVTVVERRALLAVPQPDGYALVDAHGVAFQTSTSLPDGVLRTDADPTATPLMQQLATVADALPASLRKHVDRLEATSPDHISLQLDNGVSVSWGDANESPLKAEVVAALRKKADHAIDVSAPHYPAVR